MSRGGQHSGDEPPNPRRRAERELEERTARLAEIEAKLRSEDLLTPEQQKVLDELTARSQGEAELNELEEVHQELIGDLERQLADGVSLPAVIAEDKKGRRLFKSVLMLDLGGPAISDKQWAEMIEHTAQAKHLGGEDDELAVFGAVRLAEGQLPRVLTWNTDRSLIVEATPEFAAGGEIKGWVRKRLDAFSEEPLEGEDEEGAVLSQGRPQAALEAQAEADLIPMTSKALEIFQALADEAEELSQLQGCFVKDLGGDLMAHDRYPDQLTDQFQQMELGELLARARNVQRENEGNECMVHVMPWRYDDGEAKRINVIFGYDARSESGFLTLLPAYQREEGIELGEMEAIPGERLDKLLSDYEEDA